MVVEIQFNSHILGKSSDFSRRKFSVSEFLDFKRMRLLILDTGKYILVL